MPYVRANGLEVARRAHQGARPQLTIEEYGGPRHPGVALSLYGRPGAGEFFLRDCSVPCWDKVVDDRPTGRLFTGVHRLGMEPP